MVLVSSKTSIDVNKITTELLLLSNLSAALHNVHQYQSILNRVRSGAALHPPGHGRGVRRQDHGRGRPGVAAGRGQSQRRGRTVAARPGI